MRALSLVVAALLYAGSAWAGTVVADPDMDFDSCDSCGTPGTGDLFSFSPNSTGGGQIMLKNTSGSDWTSVTIVDNNYTGTLAAVNCRQSNAFAFCSKSLVGTVLTMEYYGIGDTDPYRRLIGKAAGPDPDGDGDFFHGIANGEDFIVTLGFPNTPDVGGWPTNTSFSAAAVGDPVTVPEPTSLALLAGAAGLWLSWRASRRRSKRSLNSSV